jgi:dynein heavy chain
LWPSELEKVLDLSGARLAVVRENLETALKERRGQFEQYMLTEKKKMDSFRLRDVREVLSLDDLKEKVTTVDALMNTLEVIMLLMLPSQTILNSCLNISEMQQRSKGN